MEGLEKFVKAFFVSEIEKEGFIYIDDSQLFVWDALISILPQRQEDYQYSNATDRANTLNLLLNLFERSNFYDNGRRIEEGSLIAKKQLVSMVHYQQFLDEKGYDRRYKKQIREHVNEVIKESVKDVIILKERYYYIKDRVEPIFISDVTKLLEVFNRFRNTNTIYFRGQANIEWSLQPSVYRNGWINKEHVMFKELLIRNPNDFFYAKSTFEKLTIMQHYGLPTRLLDITRNPLVALYFACLEKHDPEMPGELIVFTPDSNSMGYYDNETVSILANLARIDRNFTITDATQPAGGTNLFTELINLIREDIPYFQTIQNPADIEKTIFVTPVNNNERIKRQQGCFLIFGIKKDMFTHSDIDFLYKEGSIKPKFIIESNKKSQILKELEMLGIHRDSLFPEIENGSEYIRQKFESKYIQMGS